MKRKPPGKSIGVAVFGAALACALVSSGAGAQSGVQGAQPLARAQVVLRNALWDSVRVELRAGPAAACDENPVLAVRTVGRGRAWGLTTDQPVCWRRAADPDAPASAWSAWTRRVLTGGTKVSVVL